MLIPYFLLHFPFGLLPVECGEDVHELGRLVVDLHFLTNELALEQDTNILY